MDSGIKLNKLKIGGMTCVSCQNKIEKALKNTAGIKNADVSYNAGTATITYDKDIISLKSIIAIIEKLDYKVLEDKQPESNKTRTMGVILVIFALAIVVQQFGIVNLANAFPLAESGTSYGMLFVIGLITSLHCVAMCGGINLSQCIPKGAAPTNGTRLESLRPSFLYNLGRVISYTIVGGIVGALGSVISFSGSFQGTIQLIAGVFMMIMGINMLGLFPWLRRFNPRMPKFFARKIETQKASSKSPLYVGLLNGLMPCGPLQAMQLYALSTGNPLSGAISMLLFSLGTVPLMFGLGALSSVLSKKFTHKVMTVGAVLVVVLGISMFSNGWSLSGFSLSSLTSNSSAISQESVEQKKTENGIQVINSTLSSGKYPAITVQAGTPVKWVINAPQGSINGCNNRIQIPEYNIEYKFKTGENVIEFTPTKTGKFPYSCWMGMIRSSITVVEAGASTSDQGAKGNSSESQADSGSSSAIGDPVLAGVAIPTDKVAVAKVADNTQEVTINITDSGISPAIVVVKANVETKWVINNTSSNLDFSTLLFPIYNTQITLNKGENPLRLLPTDSFDFSTADNAYYGYVKVVDDLNAIDINAIKKEVGSYQTLKWPPETFQSGGSGGGGSASCH